MLQINVHVLFCSHSMWCGDQNSSQKNVPLCCPFIALMVTGVSTEAHSDSCWFSQKFIIIDPFLVLNCKDKLFLFHPGCCGKLVVPNSTGGGGRFSGFVISRITTRSSPHIERHEAAAHAARRCTRRAGVVRRSPALSPSHLLYPGLRCYGN